MIDRKKLLKRNNPTYSTFEYQSPLTVGNGEFAFTADITGLQSFPEQYLVKGGIPLCTMSQWGWHATPVDESGRLYTLDDLKMTEYASARGTVSYPVKPQEGNETVYHWLRENPHRANLSNLGFVFDEDSLQEEQVSAVNQELDLYEGRLESNFHLDGVQCEVETLCDPKLDTLGVRAYSPLFKDGRLKLKLDFFYPSSNISGCDKDSDQQHDTIVEQLDSKNWKITRQVDAFAYSVHVSAEQPIQIEQNNHHALTIFPIKGEKIELTFSYMKGITSVEPTAFPKVQERSLQYWKNFWDTIGVVDFASATDERAPELERRIILSQYLTAIQGTGSLPPQETGLICNSWYGKFHLEMHLWHSAYLPLWNKPELLTGGLDWYRKNTDKARENADRNGYAGLRWPKMIGPDAVDSPSPIAPLLIWQQPHILYMLELVYQQTQEQVLLEQYWEVVEGTAAFMCDFLQKDENTGTYHLTAPLIPAQEEFDPTTVMDPVFELEYWRFGLFLAGEWAKRLGKPNKEWEEIAKHIAVPSKENGLYLSHTNCPDTYEKYNRDHPMMVGAYGLIPSDHIDLDSMAQTLEKIIDCWEFETLWGWDFAMMAMCATRLDKPELAVDLLLMDSPKNNYVKNGNNYQQLRQDLPVYLPGNGSLLLAIALMIAGTKEDKQSLPGFPKNGKWQIEYEGVSPFPY